MKNDVRFAVTRVLASRTRRNALRQLGLSGVAHLIAFLLRVVPKSQRALAQIYDRALCISDAAFRHEALTSIRAKSYHVAGACFPATFLSRKKAAAYITLVVPLETLYDYLDNLCDRHPGVPLDAYPVLHEALRDALDPTTTPGDYFRAGPARDDGGYLQYLVAATRAAIRSIPDYESLLPNLREAADYYTSLQTYKHYPAALRVAALREWHAANVPRFAHLNWWEFAAACGSQFQVYAPIVACLNGYARDAGPTYDAFFPEFCALHVLLDDFIDQSEDAAHGELNFITRYASADAVQVRFAELFHSSERGFGYLRNSHPHRLLLRILVLFYLTHPKIYDQGLDEQAQALLNAFGPRIATTT